MIDCMTIPEQRESDLGVYYVLGRLMASPRDGVRAEVDDAVQAALFRGMYIPEWITEDMDSTAVISPAWVDRQLQELAPDLLHQSSEQLPE